MEIKYLGKCLLIDKKILVVGDLHLGYEGSLRNAGVMIPIDLYKQVMEDFEEIFGRTGKVEKIVLLGDLKHEFGTILREEWDYIGRTLTYLKGKCEDLIVIIGNHDKILEPILKNVDARGVGFFIWKDFAFMHGDKSFEEVENKKVKYWIVGHGHPAVTITDGTKKEKYKCFLIGKHKGKKVIVVPSFFPLIEGTDPRDFSLGFAWDFNFKNFIAKIVGENLEVLDFGKLKDLD